MGDKDPDSPQKFSGHKALATIQNESRLTYNFPRSGYDTSQISVGFYTTLSTWVNTEPNNTTFNRLTLYNTFFDKKVEIALGTSANTSQYVGIFGDANPILATRLAGAMPIQAGLSTLSAPTPSSTCS